MARSVNKLILIGNVGSDPEVRTTRGGTKVGNFSVATDRRVGEGQEAQTDWHRITVWAGTCDFVEKHVRKGARVYVEGELRYGSYERDGVTIPTAEVNAREVMLFPRGDK